MNGQLTRTESLSLQSVYPAHFVVDAEKNLAITANYGGGAVTVVAMDNGSLSHVVQVEFLTCFFVMAFPFFQYQCHTSCIIAVIKI